MKLTKILLPIKDNKIHEWNLNPKVNIISGTNGHYKTSILKSIHEHVQSIKSNSTPPKSNFVMEFDSCLNPDSIYLCPSVPIYNLIDLIFKYQVNKSSTSIDVLIKDQLSKFNPIESENFLMALHMFMPTYIPDKNIHTQDLTFSERYLLYILLTTANTNNKPSILLLDNIGGYLHPTWQQKLIHGLTIINPNLQIIIGTQIPNIINGWKEHDPNTNQLNINEYIHPKYDS